MLRVEGTSNSGDFARIGRCNINFSSEIAGEARVNLPLELSLPAGTSVSLTFYTFMLPNFSFV